MHDLRTWLKTGIEVLSCCTIVENHNEHLSIRYRVFSTGKEYVSTGERAEAVLRGIRNAWDRLDRPKNGQDLALEELRRVSEPLERMESLEGQNPA